ncbi:biopolymer transporter ExbD [Myxococcus sp. CA051A]|uniref:Biopolymer transporter ExbD n=1 Tax=Myxococcus llanfairpwllgwyngyllgogerychwyrndrobwllllantysiliogogogochensis TaxID=2590453 RepID=A0A540WQI2_9BACT|nr:MULTISPECIES: biopolymer transporter ExbD [Myxococcus]NTX06833.1 biopolymer transporter ExbD [Myxococcus sp. CA040A]NTX13858.1 biopolymer transporter ExbD [Myxococcus sp. CA056]NTX38463.1 biopolymer transporter ExbD [Myxococcus sp. CA033]NTX58413.1 biopolymer transporter ExbD [Myxococcus sp. CA039A]NTX62473.1 biopolymer transporter ExbD [Myxococcus sp. CA051A]
MAGGTQPRGGLIEGINVTPLVDIMLVLLIIFMVTARLVDSPAVPLDLPKASQSEDVQTVFAVSITATGQLLVNGEGITEAALRDSARHALVKDPELRAVIQADGAVPHRQVIAVLDQLKEAGLTKVAFGTVRPAEPATPETPATEDGRVIP